MVRSARALVLVLVLDAPFTPIRVAAQSGSPASITVLVQTFGKPHSDFPATIQIHSKVLDSDLSTIVDTPSSVVFPNLPPGPYQVLVSSGALSPVHLDLNLSPDQSIELSLILDHLFPLILEPRHSLTSSAAPFGEFPPPDFTAAKFDSFLALYLRAPIAPTPSQFASCPLGDVLPHVSANAREFVDNVNRITATEILKLERRRGNGKLEDTVHIKANYVANIQLRDSRYFSVDEYRDGHANVSGFIEAFGSTTLVLVFHPVHLDQFDITCKGLAIWKGTPAYLLNFQQRPDRPNTMSAFSTRRGNYAISLKGTAWVDATTFQVIHLETDLLNPIPELFLDFEHQSLDYGPVVFAARHVSLWLPQSVDITVHLSGKQFNARHSYSNYQLFVVETGQKIAKPKDISN
ncbi:MAG: hypothetical protein WAM58_18725 [Candidatus Acidiferrum sp.]